MGVQRDKQQPGPIYFCGRYWKHIDTTADFQTAFTPGQVGTKITNEADLDVYRCGHSAFTSGQGGTKITNEADLDVYRCGHSAFTSGQGGTKITNEADLDVYRCGQSAVEC
jgi:hypothetical protein